MLKYILTVILTCGFFVGVVHLQEEVNGDKKIINGRYALIGEFPFIVSIQWKTINYQRCGGTILNRHFVLTACHCIRDFPFTDSKNVDINSLFVLAGSNNRHSKTRVQIRLPEIVFVHPKCKAVEEGEMASDLALIKVSSPFLLTKYTQPGRFAIIPSAKKLGPKFYNNCTGIGWGATEIRSSGGYRTFADELKVIGVTVLGEDFCEVWLCSQNVFYCSDHDEYSLICGLGQGGDVCIGDSGGPLVCDGYIIGIASWGPECGELGHPTIYEEVNHFHSFFSPVTDKIQYET